MKHTKVLVNEFEAYNGFARITGKSGYEQSTDIWVKQKYTTNLTQNVTDTEHPGFNLRSRYNNDNAYRSDQTFAKPNINGKLSFDIPSGVINKSLSGTTYHPVGAVTHYNCYPNIQRTLLPYLTPQRVIDNVDYDSETQLLTPTDDNQMPDSFTWDPSINGNFVLTRHRSSRFAMFKAFGGPQTLNNNNIDNTGFLARDQIEFGTVRLKSDAATFVPFADPKTIEIVYNKSLDRLEFNMDTTRILAVRLEGDRIGGTAGDNVVFVFDGDSLNHVEHVEPGAVVYNNGYINLADQWFCRFDLNGIAGRAELDEFGEEKLHGHEYGLKRKILTDWVAQRFNADELSKPYSEFFEIILRDSVYDKRPADHNGNNWVMGVDDRITLWLRKPKFSRGRPTNWKMTPGLDRFVKWYGKHSANQPTSSTTLTRFWEFSRTDSVDFRPAGNFIGHVTVDFGDSVVQAANRHILNWQFTFLPAQYDEINALGQEDEVHFIIILQGNPLVKNGAVPDYNWPTDATRANVAYQAALVPGDDVGDYFCICLRKHLTPDNANHRFNCARTSFYQPDGITLIQELVNGANVNVTMPQLCSAGSLNRDNAANNHARSWMGLPATRLALVMSNNLSATYSNANTGGFKNTAVPHSEAFQLGSRSIFPVVADDYFYHRKVVNAAGNDVLYIALAEMFFENAEPARITTTEPDFYPSYSSVGSRRNVVNFELDEPLFGLDSGMATYGVQNIYYPKLYYPLVIQDIDINLGDFDKNKLGITNIKNQYEGTGEFFDSTMVVTMERIPNNQITLRSRDGLDQREKHVVRVDRRYPMLYPYSQTVASGSSEARFSLYYERGVPDYIFVFCETQQTTLMRASVDREPKVTQLNFFGRMNNDRSLCDYLTEKQLWRATRRNSNILSSMDELQKIGGVLISKTDLGSLEREEYANVDCFDYDVVVNFERTAANTQPVKITLCVIFENKLIMQGGFDNLNFFEEKRY